MEEMRREILEVLQEMIEHTQEAAVITEIKGTSLEALHTKFTLSGRVDRDVVVSFMFIPHPQIFDIDYETYAVQICIADDVPKETFVALKQAIPFLNCMTTWGTFVTTPDCKCLIYKNTAKFLKTDDMENIVNAMYYNMVRSLMIAGSWIDPLYSVIDGEMDLLQFLKTMDDVFAAMGGN